MPSRKSKTKVAPPEEVTEEKGPDAGSVLLKSMQPGKLALPLCTGLVLLPEGESVAVDAVAWRELYARPGIAYLVQSGLLAVVE